MDKNRIRSNEPGDVGEGYPVGRWDDYVISLIEESGKDIEYGVLAANIDKTFGVGILRPKITRMFLDNGFLQLFDAAGCRVFCEVRLNRADSGLLHIFRRREVGLTRTE